jgi:hypothetical protein
MSLARKRLAASLKPHPAQHPNPGKPQQNGSSKKPKLGLRYKAIGCYLSSFFNPRPVRVLLGHWTKRIAMNSAAQPLEATQT